MYVALDLGLKHIGIAISKSLIVATPYKILYIQKNLTKELISEIISLNKEKKIRKLFYGIPKHLDGSESYLSLYFQKLMNKVKKHFSEIEFIAIDERLSTTMSSKKKTYKDKRNDDVVAAELLTIQLDKLYRERGYSIKNSE